MLYNLSQSTITRTKVATHWVQSRDLGATDTRNMFNLSCQPVTVRFIARRRAGFISGGGRKKVEKLLAAEKYPGIRIVSMV